MGYGDGQVYDPNSAPSAYITAEEFFDFVDYNLIGEVLADTRGQAYTLQQLTTPGEQANTRLNNILMAASGLVEMEAMAGRMYTAESLMALTGNAKKRLHKIIADLAVFDCYCRRDGADPPQNIILRYQEAVKVLDRLRLGDMIFPFLETEQAGLPSTQPITLSQMFNAGRPSLLMPRFFGQRLQERTNRSF